MRNIIEYPVTLPEIVATLTQIAEEFRRRDAEELAIGDMRGMLVGMAAKLLTELHLMTENTPDHLPTLSACPNDHQIEDHGAALVEYAFRTMVRKALEI
jgi:hypothetical protein